MKTLIFSIIFPLGTQTKLLDLSKTPFFFKLSYFPCFLLSVFSNLQIIWLNREEDIKPTLLASRKMEWKT